MTSAYSINLNFNNTIPVKTDFTFKQGDKGITLNLATTGLDPTGTTAHIVFKRSNGTSVEAELTGQTGPSYSYTILGNEFEIPGVVVADLKLYNGDTQRVSTASFIFLVTGDTMDGVGGGTGGYSDQLEELSQEFSDTLEEYKDAFGDVGAVNPRGAYDSTADYNVLDLVSYQGSSYLCRTACKNKVPTNTTYWQVFASGAQGVDYGDLTGKPSINSVTLSGNKTTEDLGLFSGDYNDLDNRPSIPADIDDLSDVDMTGVTDGQVPTWDATAQKYKPGTPTGGGGGTNPNLLHNPWFTVNQRGFTSRSGSDTYNIADRWFISTANSSASVTLNNNMLTLTATSGEYGINLRQKMDNDLTGAKVTLSVLFSDGTIESATSAGTVPAKTPSQQDVIPETVVYGGKCKLYFRVAPTSNTENYIVQIFTTVGNSITIKAAKLEVGSVSTLHLDTAPDYTTELLKCQRYFRRLGTNTSSTNFSYGYAEKTTEARIMLMLPVPMRTIPTLTTSGTFTLNMAGTNTDVSSMSLQDVSTTQLITIKCACTGLTVGAMVKLYAYSNGANIDLSSEL